MPNWIIFYDNGATFCDKDGEPELAPDRGVVCIADRSQKGTVHKFDWYYWRTDIREWWGSDLHGLLYQLRQRAVVISKVLEGAMVSNSFYQKCMARAFEARTEKINGKL